MLENTLISITHSQTPIASGRQALKGGEGWCKVACQLNTHIGDLELYKSYQYQFKGDYFVTCNLVLSQWLCVCLKKFNLHQLCHEWSCYCATPHPVVTVNTRTLDDQNPPNDCILREVKPTDLKKEIMEATSGIPSILKVPEAKIFDRWSTGV